MRKSIPFLLVLLCLPLRAQTPHLVKDINRTLALGATSSNPGQFAAFRDRIFFSAEGLSSGKELWSTDGAGAEAAMVEINPGNDGSDPAEFVAVNGILLFTARDFDHGDELWTTDGTTAGTHILVDINPGRTSSAPLSKTLYKNQILFTADDGTHGRELWTSDGTVSGTHMVRDISPGPTPSVVLSLMPFNDSVYFAAFGGLWKTDGTEAGTVEVASVRARNLRAVGSQLFFQGFTVDAGWEPWVSDGTRAGTRMVADILPGTNGSVDSNFSLAGFTPLTNRVLFLATDGVHGREMWISDGTAAGTRMVRDFVSGAPGMWDSAFANITTLGTRAYFSAADPQHGLEVWVTDGTDPGTSLFADITPGPDSSGPSVFSALGGKLYVAVRSSPSGSRLWVTDGTSAGSRLIGGPDGPFLREDNVSLWPVDGKMYFAGTNTLNGSEPWVTDGTDAGTRMIANIGPDTAPSSSPHNLTAASPLLFFIALGETFSSQGLQNSLWRSDGTEAGTFSVTSLTENPSAPVAAASLLFFNEGDPNKPALMITDGTREGTKSADDFLKRFGGLHLGRFFPFGSTLFASIYESDVNDSVLWVTKANLNALAVSLGARNPFGLIEVAGHYYFYTHASQYGLWTTDGTPAGTHSIVPDLGELSGPPSKLANADGTVFFLESPNNGAKTSLWRTDGTPTGTTMVKELSGTENGRSEIKAVGRRIFFVNADALWVSDGTASGTIQLAKVHLSVEIDNDHLQPVGNGVVFVSTDFATNTSSLWTSDGTVEGTRPLRELGSSRLAPAPDVTAIDGTAYFPGDDEVHGTEIWTTDGTIAGTKLLFDLNPGPASSNPFNFTKVGNLLYFSAFTDATGAELWALPLTLSHIAIDDVGVAEGDSGTTVAQFNVTLSPAASQTVTVDYATSDGTATAGQDYDATSGTLTFAAGEATKTIDVRVHGDALPESNETFFITLRNASGAGILRSEAVAVIEDGADQLADVSIVPAFTTTFGALQDTLTVSNSGPGTATDVALRFTSTPSSGDAHCFGCVVPPLAAGTSFAAFADYAAQPEQVYVGVTETARQRDPQSSNNSTSWTVNSGRAMAMTPAYLTPGQTAAVVVVEGLATRAVASSDPSVVSVPARVSDATNHLAGFALTALKAGTSSVSIEGVPPLLVTVVAPGAQPRWPGAVAISTDRTATPFDLPMVVSVIPSGRALFTGATPTGSVVVSAGPEELARRTITGTGALQIPAYLPSRGAISYVVTYSGDANFLPQSFSDSIFVHGGTVVLIASLQPVPGTAGTFSLTVRVTGSPFAPPAGTVSVTNGAAEIARLSLVASGSGTSTAQATLTDLPPSNTLTLNYSGDAFYNEGSQQVRAVVGSRHRAGRH